MFKNAVSLVRGRLIPKTLFLAVWILPVAAAANPSVVVSIKPLHSIVSALMEGVAAPQLLISGSTSPHGFALKPSQARRLQTADAIFWVGADLERFLVKSLKTLPRDAKVVAVSHAVKLLPFRDDGAWAHQSHEGEHAKHNHAHHDDHGVRDPHFWLDPARVQAILPVLVKTLSEVDAAHASRYRENGEAVFRRLAVLDLRLRRKLVRVRNAPYLVFHDAYQYFEKRYGLRAVGTIRLNPEYRPGARHIGTIQRRIAEGDIRCLFREPQFRPPALGKGSVFGGLRIAVLDPLGASQKAGANAYFDMMDGLADSLAACLNEES